MSKRDYLAYIIIGLGVGLGFIVGGRLGLAIGIVGTIAGLVFLGFVLMSTPAGPESQPVDAALAYSAHQETKILLMVRDAHARQVPESEADDFDVFLNVWLLSETELDLGIKECQLKITAPGSSTMVCERISGDLEKWHLGKEKEEWDMWNTSDVHAVRESILELNTTEPLKVGVRREGWLHFRIQNISPEQFKTVGMEVLIEDSLSHKHVAAVNCPRHLPGKVWPIRGRRAQPATS
jgi:hypothetical protein